ncbi:MAG: DNA-3-methyladenine glycosylase 2 family protein [Xanthomonadales bacterium]|nr:DNA-3-methyladenine glycosylase 2 family protein [Xanthomonadales bacterium]
MPKTLNNKRLEDAAKALADLDEGMAGILKNHGTPPLWDRPPGFETLIRIILEQQVSLVSADAMYRRLQDNIQPITPETIIAAGEMHLRSFGVTRQKASYFVNVAVAIQSGELDLAALEKDADETAIEKLTAVKGVGPWTAKIYLLMVLCRPDVWPVGDVALATAVKNLKGWETRPAQAELSGIAKNWRPHRATAARMLWHYYLNGM